MLSLTEAQARIRAAVVESRAVDLAPWLVGGPDPVKRMGIYVRHYETSLVEALMRRFPAVVWLIGGTFVSEAARAFVHRHPPAAPCIAEYGEEFPAFLAGRVGARVPYLQWFGRMEWHLGHVALAIERPPLAMDSLSKIEPDALPDLIVSLQLGVRYLDAPWPIDDLMRLFIAETAPEQFAFDAGSVWLEIRGARGEFRINRLDAGTLAFRTLISQGKPIGAAAERALEIDATFDPGRALAMLVDEGLVTAITPPGNRAP